jgi:catechol 2,3-dioxygenase-like lactoylglutathione lyase family enzyme
MPLRLKTLSLRHLFPFALLVSFATVCAAQQRPPIPGISHMCVYAHDMSASDAFYTHDLGATKASDPQNPAGARYYFSPTQFVEVLPLPADHTNSRMACVAYNTTNAAELLKYMQAKGVQHLSELHTSTDGSRWFDTQDPEGNVVQFLQPDKAHAVAITSRPISTRIIHMGYLVHSRADEDHFYRDILGFRPYWYGAMKPNKLDWVSQEVPNGYDWIEYMLAGDGSDTPSGTLSQNQLGVMNHFSLGVPNMEQAVQTLYQQDRLPPRHDGPQMGKDGKWQANLYDPDGTRVELMEFQPVMKPCCSDFTAASPTH